MTIYHLSFAIVFLPLLSGLIAGFWGKKIGKLATHRVTIAAVGLSFLLALCLANKVILQGQTFSGAIYTWLISGSFEFHIGFLIDNLTVLMMITVTFISLIVHVYSIGYMQDDAGYQRFFSYISLFTFAMLMLVTANNFLQLFFGWEGVGLISYLLIGFWFKRESANAGSLKAFLVNRVGDFGFILGIAGILTYFGTLDYAQVFAAVPDFSLMNPTISLFPNTSWSVLSVICIALFVGAMGKSAQMPLHVWLPESMEGPTPISALIHAATMVTAGIYMVARLSPLFEYSYTALSFILIIGATTAIFTGLIAIVQNDIKRIVAYSTLSQLGYMVAALGVSAFSASIFHLMTHACFKALLFLAAGSVILAMHHEQDIRKMGNLKKYMPITYICFLIGALALAAVPPFSGFYSKDLIIESVQASTMTGAHYAYICLLLGAFVTAFYIFRALFLTFHTQARMDEHLRASLKENSWVICLPLILLAIPSLVLGALLIQPMIFSSDHLLMSSVKVMPEYNTLTTLRAHFQGVFLMAIKSFESPAVWFSLLGIISAWVCYIVSPAIPDYCKKHFSWIYRMLVDKYGFDRFNQWVFVKGVQRLAKACYLIGDIQIVDNGLVNGSGRLMTRLSRFARKLQTGYLYDYAFAMILGVIALLVWLLF
jgi:NADH-quinone oxidoreductase subunit L